MTDSMPDFEEFWQRFIQSHRSAAVRWCHVAALGCGAAGLLGALTTRRVFPLILGGGGMAAFAVLSHPIFTGHWPENSGRPLYGARAFLRLCLRTVNGSI